LLYGILLTMLTSFVYNVHHLVFRVCLFVSIGHLKFCDVTIIGAYGRHYIMTFWGTYIGDEKVDITITTEIDEIASKLQQPFENQDEVQGLKSSLHRKWDMWLLPKLTILGVFLSI